MDAASVELSIESFEHPQRLWLLLAVPILLLLMARVRQKALLQWVPSLALWRRALQVQSPTRLLWLRRLRQILQALVLSGFVLLLAGPRRSIDVVREREVVLLVDCSASTALPAEDGRPLREHVLERAEALVRALGPQQRTGLGFVGEGLKTVLARAQQEEVLRALSDPPSARGEVETDILVQVARLAREQAEVYFVSPFAPEAEAETRLNEAGLRCIKAGVPADEAGIVSAARAGGEALRVVVAGRGRRTLTLCNAAGVEWSAEVEAVSAGVTVTVPLSPACGELLTLRLMPMDRHPSDDTAILVLPERKKLAVLVVSDRETVHIEAALAASRRVEAAASGKVSFAAAANTPMQPDLVILHGVDWSGPLPAARALLLEATLSGASLEVQRQTRTPADLKPTLQDEPLLRGLSLGDLALSDVPLCRVGADAEVLLATSAGPLLVRGQSHGAKFMALTLDPEGQGHNLAGLPLFPLLMERCLNDLCPTSGLPLPLVLKVDEPLLLLPEEEPLLYAADGGGAVRVEARQDGQGFVAPALGLWRSSRGRWISVANLRPISDAVPLRQGAALPSVMEPMEYESLRPRCAFLLLIAVAMDWALWIVIVRRSSA
jgi:hypothetical protein